MTAHIRLPPLSVRSPQPPCQLSGPAGSALWPAFWLLPQVGAWMQSTCLGCGAYGNWAASGEIDVAEAANDMTSVQGTIHYGGLYPQNVQSHGSVYLPPNTSLADDFHVYAIEWEYSQVIIGGCLGRE